jgi:hypothetical protein
MPIFDVFTINHKHLALVTIAKQQQEVENVDDDDILRGYIKWRNYIRKQLKNNKSLTSTAVEHIFE